MADRPWYALATEDGRYLGTAWQSNSSGGLVRPRTELVPLECPRNESVSTYPTREDAVRAADRACQILGNMVLTPVPVRVEGRGPRAKLTTRPG